MTLSMLVNALSFFSLVMKEKKKIVSPHSSLYWHFSICFPCKIDAIKNM
jgi:hypothetical protein